MSSDNEPRGSEPVPVPGLGVTDIYFILFRRKWLVILGLLLGVLAASFLWENKKPLYKSEAKLLVKGIKDTSLISIGEGQQVRVADPSGRNIVGSEVQILTSHDIAKQVAESVGPSRILFAPPSLGTLTLTPSNEVMGAAALAAAAGVIAKNLEVSTPARTDALVLHFSHPEAEVAQEVLTRLIDAYLEKHDQIHHSLGHVEALTSQQEELLRRLTEADATVKERMKNAGVVSVEESKTTLLAQESQLRQDRFRVLADLADRQATLAAFTKLGAAASGAADAANIRVPGLDQYEEYEALRQQIKLLMVELQKNTGLDPSVAQVRKLQDQLEATKERKAHLEKTFPGLRRVPGGIPGVSTAQVLPDVDTQNAIVKGLEARATQLSNDLHVVRTEIEKINDLENEIAPVVVRRDLLKVQYASVARQLQDERLEGALANGQSASVSRVQNPSPATRDLGSLLKAMMMAIVGGLGGGVALAFLMELWLDRTLKRPKDVEQALRAPLLVSIPKLRLKPKRRAAQLNGKVVGNGHGGGSGPAQEAFSEGRERVAGLQPFHESIRDSLVNYFEARQMTHKPKLIAVTSCADGAGVSSIANGLAASLSQTGDGNVLLVDMRAERSEAHAFCEGKPVCGLEEALEGGSRTSALVQENLYLGTAEYIRPAGGPPRGLRGR